ncbi:MAG: TetR/AcrR family transcriptional regulator [Desulfovibrionaceae bacterium]
MAISERKRRQNRDDILLAAEGVFLSDGYVGASMDRIARQAGVTKQTVYRYFPSKEALFQATLDARREGADSRFLEALDQDGADPREALTRFAVGFLEMHMTEAHLAGIRLLVAEGPKAPEMTRAFYAVGPSRTRERLARFLAERLGAEDPDYAVTMLLSTLLSLRMNVLVGLRPIPGREELLRHAERTVAACIRGLNG